MRVDTEKLLIEAGSPIEAGTLIQAGYPVEAGYGLAYYGIFRRVVKKDISIVMYR